VRQSFNGLPSSMQAISPRRGLGMVEALLLSIRARADHRRVLV
jgi:hypothetical protein